ncbi:hypothetical protein GCM10010109_90450 [Actinoplanes campanulatus]|nr:hypothetical protein GCM10010109_90450 [Actinoplanes campanulatus]GID42148.1 hypothetical protein Aca09nite_86540 [Actinoplanes campanulatus]
MKAYPLALVPLVPAVPVATWWLVGDLTETSGDIVLDYAYQPVTFGEAGDVILGVVAFLTALAALGVLLHGTVTGRMRNAWWGVAVSILAIGAYLGWAERIWTAGVIGANIGVGLTFLFGVPFVVTFLLPSVWSLVVLRRARRTEPQPSPQSAGRS